MVLTLLGGQVAALFLEGILYGVYLTTFVISLRWFLYDDNKWKRLRDVNWPMLIVTLCMFVISSLDLALAGRRSFVGILHAELGTPLPNLLWSGIVQSFLVHLQSVVADAVLMYRCWVVFGRDYRVVVFPFFLWLAEIATMIARAVFQPHDSTMVLQVRQVQAVFWACTTGNTVYSTSMIAYRITSVAKMNNNPTRQLRFVLRVIIESGLMIVTTSILAFIFSFPSNPFSTLFVSAITFMVIGIAFNLILIRIMNSRSDDVVYTRPSAMTTIRFTSIGTALTQSSTIAGDQDLEQGKPMPKSGSEQNIDNTVGSKLI
ncbi:hypothetical protein AMATHDRAFT_6164 [Amanita thiersii Skay4041]|uniref:Uncharacterized protein n=1 Tax=Amanita thiersii Skay4041 TaxID=703135 RepID=A0A2A9NIF0_9AGAR|nr:hypothetical protein AMATHDRAFT_6164 [Amanita thiersii Skay4041]